MPDSSRRTQVFRELSTDKCIARLSEGGVGRVAVCMTEGPVIIPVNYVMDGDSVLFRTAPYTLLAAHAWGPAAFEIDDIDHDMNRGWSVLVTGRMSPVTDADESFDLVSDTELEPWAPGSRNMYIRIAPERITGREVAR
jgi:nitroimidazol reductase NimA-like FMN-containing flavoprotein (pyridoxamine 5'-phosphate oxidase superfamily)